MAETNITITDIEQQAKDIKANVEAFIADINSELNSSHTTLAQAMPALITRILEEGGI